MSEQPTDIRVELATLLSNVDQAAAITADEMNQVSTFLGGLWTKTEGDEDAHALITQAWEHVSLVAEQNAALSFQAIAGGNIAQTALAEEKIAREELGNIQDALEKNDETHPALERFADALREDVEEELDERIMEEIWPEAMESAFEDHRENLQHALATLTGFDYHAVAEATSILEGFSEPTTSQRELLRAFVAECDAVVRRLDAKRAEARRGA